MNINLDWYKIFYCVAKNKNISKAANELNISQPAVSKSIKNLEKNLNCNLFVRSNNGVDLTSEGKYILIKIENALNLINEVESDINAINSLEIGKLNIGVSSVILDEYLLPFIVQFNNKYPKIELKILSDNVDLLEQYRLGLVDVVFTNMPTEYIPKGATVKKLIDLENVFVCNNKYNYLKNKKLKKEDLVNLDLLLLKKDTINRERIDNFCKKNKLKIKPKMELGSNSLIKSFALNGLGIGMIDLEHVKDEIKDGKLFKLDIDIELDNKYLALFYNPNNNKKSLVEFIKILNNK